MWWCSSAASVVYHRKHRFQHCTASSPQNLFSCCILSCFHIFRYARCLIKLLYGPGPIHYTSMSQMKIFNLQIHANVKNYEHTQLIECGFVLWQFQYQSMCSPCHCHTLVLLPLFQQVSWQVPSFSFWVYSSMHGLLQMVLSQLPPRMS